jgi:glycosyltransferase involved in cell wall biosynthesis
MADVARIAHVALQLETGGMERVLVDFARNADRRRYHLRFVVLGSRGPIADELEAAGWPVTALDARPGVRASIVFRLARLFEAERIDVVHAHNTKPLFYAGPAARLAGVRSVVYTRHGQRTNATRRQNVLYRLACRSADHIVCVSDDSRRRCHAEGVDARSIRTIWNGIDRGRFRSTGYVAQGPAVFVGRLSPEKNVRALLLATAAVVARDDAFRLWIAGDGPCAVELAALARSLDLDGHVRFLGEVRDVRPLMQGASMFVLSSISEGLPLTILEAMACGLPVVATRVGGTPEAVTDGESGLLVEVGSHEQLAQAMIALRRDPARAARMGRAGERRVERDFDVRVMVSRYEALYAPVGQSATTATESAA